tara:strand:+ start:2439 stop:2675 length:237 start_codon:yes stop_codon:yes gene_type:complete
MNSKELRWKCRKGIRELDILLEKYLNNALDKSSDVEKKLFEEMIEWDTCILLNAILGKSQYNNKYKIIIEKLSKLNDK